ncbi:MAG: toxin-antitoxin system TumE family protein [Rhodocyclaceae bacterium]
MTATLIIDFKDVTPAGDIIQMRVWHVPQPVAPSKHEFKYSLFYRRGTQRIVGFDNERGKRDHCHIDGIERPYRFTDIERLIEDFIAAVAERRKT